VGAFEHGGRRAGSHAAALARATLTGWLRAAGLTGIELRRGAGPIAVLRGTVPGS
jgi:hypothetical protein